MKEEKDEDISIGEEDLDPEGKSSTSYGAGDSEVDVADEYLGDTVKKLKEKLKGAEEKAREYLDGWQRERADIANARKRDEEAKKDFARFASESVLAELIPVLDSFDLAVSHGSKEIVPIQKQLLSVLKTFGLETSDPVGEHFDPRQHEAVATVSAESEEDDHKILEVVQKGYILSGKIIRPAKVKIGQING